MKRLTMLMLVFAIVSVLMCHLWEANAQESCENVTYTVIGGPSSDNIISVYKIDDNNFYILTAGLPFSSPANAPSGFVTLIYHLYYYTNGTWNTILDSSRDPFETSSLTNLGGGGSTEAFAVGHFGQVFKIDEIHATQWNGMMGAVNSWVDLEDVCVADSTIVAVGLEQPTVMGNPTKAVICTSPVSSPNWVNRYTMDQGITDKCFNAVAFNGGQGVAVGYDGSSPLGAYSSDYGSNWTQIDFSGVSGVPPLVAASYDPDTGIFYLAGDSTIVHYRLGNNPVSDDLHYLPDNGQIFDLYQNIAVGLNGDMMATGGVYCNDGQNWLACTSVPSSLPQLNGGDGGSDVFIVGDGGTVLRRESTAGGATSVPTLSQWGIIIFILVTIVCGIGILRKKIGDFPAKGA
ncbi:MAG: hypothetical protein JXO48_02595 [Deltaproteobacteria bacterium]|nr:hypothetical protein [Deltaproteobacteria bacterium]